MRMVPVARRTCLAVLAGSFLVTFRPVRLHAQTPAATGEVQAEGTLEVQYEDDDRGGRLRHFLDTPAGRFELIFDGAAPGLLSGSRVRVRGRQQNNTLMLSSSGGSVQTLSLAAANTFGTQQTLVVLINFQDNATQPYTVATAQDVTFNQTSSYYLENTYQQTSLAGTVVGWYTIAANGTTCDTNTWASLADQAAANHGVNVSAYPRRIYGFPQTSACSWWGLGSVGGNPSRAWINGSYALRVVGHELGHNLGDYHSHSLSCDSTTCTASEYGDDRDIMGATTGHMNAFQKERLGWLNYGSSPPIQTVTAGDNYWIEPLETLGIGGPKALKILKSTDASGYRTWYYVESRAKMGYDGSVTAGVVVHTGSESSGNSSYETDLQPATTAWDSTLDPAQNFSDPAIGLTITTLSADSSGALVQVAFGPLPCNVFAPAVSLSPSATTWVRPGTTASYALSVTNSDSSGCAPAAFSLTPVTPSGWTASVTPASLTGLAAGATASAALTVSIPAGASGGQTVSVSAWESGAPAAGSASVSMIVASALDVAVATDKATYKGGTVIATSTVSGNSAPVAGAAVVFTLTSGSKVVTLNGTTGANGVATASYRFKPKDPKGAWQVTVSATKDAVSGAGSAAFTVQ